MNNKKIIFASIAIIGVVFFSIYNYIYQNHRDIQSEKAAYTLKAVDLAKAFLDNEEEATVKYLNKTIEIEGNLSGINATSVTVDNVIFLAIEENESLPASHLLNTVIHIKGRCIGYDSLLEEVKLDQSSLIK